MTDENQGGYQASDIEIDDRTRLLVAYSEYMRWMLSFPKRKSHTFTGATIIPKEAMKSIGLCFAHDSKINRTTVGLSFNPTEYGFLTEIGIFAAYWEESGITLMLNTQIINLTSVPFIRLHFSIDNPVQLAKAQRSTHLFILEVVPNGRAHGSTGFKPTRLYPTLIEIRENYSVITQPKKKVLNRVFGK